jgi:hypothetical protein
MNWCIFCNEQFRKGEAKTECIDCHKPLYERSKQADCQFYHDAFQKYFPNLKGETKAKSGKTSSSQQANSLTDTNTHTLVDSDSCLAINWWWITNLMVK